MKPEKRRIWRLEWTGHKPRNAAASKNWKRQGMDFFFIRFWFCPCVLYRCSWKPFPSPPTPPLSPSSSPLVTFSLFWEPPLEEAWPCWYIDFSPVIGLWTSGLQSYKRIHGVLNHQVCSNWLQQPQETNTYSPSLRVNLIGGLKC